MKAIWVSARPYRERTGAMALRSASSTAVRASGLEEAVERA
jgi:hypothetical protein